MEFDLNEMRNLEISVRHYSEQLELWQTRIERLTGVRYDKLIIQGGSPLEIESMLDSINEVKKSLENILMKLAKMQHAYMLALETLPKHYADLLNARFVDCKSYDTISKEMNYSRRQVLRMMSVAKKQFNATCRASSCL